MLAHRADADADADAGCEGALGGSNQLLMQRPLNSTFGLTFWAPAVKAFISRLTSGIGKPLTMPIVFA